MYDNVINETTQRFRKLMESNNWSKQTHLKSPVTVSTLASSDKTSHIVRGEAILENCTTTRFCEIIDTFDIQIRSQFDPLCESVTLLKKYNEDIQQQVIRVAFNAPTFVVSKRDFIYVRETIVNGNETLIVCTSPSNEDDESFRSVNGYVRGTLKTTVWQFIENDDGSLYVCYLNHADYAGYVPNFLINIAVLDQPLVVERVANLLKCRIKPGL
jgi:hypothetical protein